jgi:hypothetical protein
MLIIMEGRKKGRTQTEVVRKQDAKENIWT